MNTKTEAKHTPFHHHPADGGFREDCKRCRLDAASPELLEACKGLLAMLELLNAPGTHDPIEARVYQARAAISKAEKGAQ
jgi:hypothetical protein